MRTVIFACAAFVAAVAAAQTARDPDVHRASQFRETRSIELQRNYELEGTVESVDARHGRITIAREDAPPATLAIAPDTRVRIDGDRAEAIGIQAGSDVRATFNLALQTPLAIDLHVTSHAPDGEADSSDVCRGVGRASRWDGHVDGCDDPNDPAGP